MHLYVRAPPTWPDTNLNAVQANLRFLTYCVQCASLSLIYYDYVLTLRYEIRYIWGEKIRFMTALYAFCRYALVANVLYLLIVTKTISTSCWFLIVAISIIARASILTVWTIRTWSVWQRNNWVLALLGTILLVVVVLDVISSTPIGSANSDRVLALCVVCHEWTSTILSGWRCFTTIRFSKEFTHLSKHSIYHEILGQGVLYILGVSVFTITAMLLAFVAPDSLLRRLLNALTLPVSGLLTARFILHMRSFADSDRRDMLPTNLVSLETTEATSLRFRSMGSSVSHVPRMAPVHPPSRTFQPAERLGSMDDGASGVYAGYWRTRLASTSSSSSCSEASGSNHRFD